jgi:hypothetical protein
MSWGYYGVTLACKCVVATSAKQWDELWVGAYQQCKKHGDTTVARMDRVYESTGSRNASLTIGVPQTGESKGPRSKDLLTPPSDGGMITP